MEQKATIDAVAALAFGMYVHVNPVPFVTGAPRLVKLLTEDLPSVTGGKLAVETDPVEAVGGDAGAHRSEEDGARDLGAHCESAGRRPARNVSKGAGSALHSPPPTFCSAPSRDQNRGSA